MSIRKRLPFIGGILVLAWLLVVYSKGTRLGPNPPPPSQAQPPVPSELPFAREPGFTSYDEAIGCVRSHYPGESIDTRRSSWITSAEYFPAEGRGYLILGMRGRPYIFAGVPPQVWQEFKDAPSLGSYYNQNIRGQYRLNLQ